MIDIEKVMYELIGRVSVLESNVRLLQDRITELEGGGTTSHVATMKEGRDKTRYKLDGKEYLKNRFVWAVIKKYIQENEPITYDELIRVFADQNQGSFGCVRRVDPNLEKLDPPRYFCKKEDQLKVADGKVIVCNQWDIRRVKNIVEIAKKLGYSVEEIKA